jgi:hypothetical protein
VPPLSFATRHRVLDPASRWLYPAGTVRPQTGLCAWVGKDHRPQGSQDPNRVGLLRCTGGGTATMRGRGDRDGSTDRRRTSCTQSRDLRSGSRPLREHASTRRWISWPRAWSAAVLAATAAPALASTYSMTGPWLVGYGTTVATGIDASGQISGESYLGAEVQTKCPTRSTSHRASRPGYAFLWSNGTMTDLGTSAERSGRIVGFAQTSSDADEGFLYVGGGLVLRRFCLRTGSAGRGSGRLERTHPTLVAPAPLMPVTGRAPRRRVAVSSRSGRFHRREVRPDRGCTRHCRR